MDSKKRHELETNDLREFLDNFKDFWEKNGNSILIALIVVVGGYAGYNWYTKNKVAKANDGYQALADASGGAVLRSVAEEFPRVRDSALQRSGDDYLAQARTASAAGDEADKTKALDNAQDAYQTLLDTDAADVLKINAYLGLAAAAEMRGQWDDAKGFYGQAHELAGERYTRLAHVAQAGKDKVDDLRNPVAFGEDDPVPTPGLGSDLLPIDPIDPSDVDGNGVPDRLERPDNLETTPGTIPGTSPGDNPLFPNDDPAIGNPLGGDSAPETPEFDPLLQPGGAGE